MVMWKFILCWGVAFFIGPSYDNREFGPEELCHECTSGLEFLKKMAGSRAPVQWKKALEKVYADEGLAYRLPRDALSTLAVLIVLSSGSPLAVLPPGAGS